MGYTGPSGHWACQGSPFKPHRRATFASPQQAVSVQSSPTANAPDPKCLRCKNPGSGVPQHPSSVAKATQHAAGDKLQGPPVQDIARLVLTTTHGTMATANWFSCARARTNGENKGAWQLRLAPDVVTTSLTGSEELHGSDAAAKLAAKAFFMKGKSSACSITLNCWWFVHFSG